MDIVKLITQYAFHLFSLIKINPQKSKVIEYSKVPDLLQGTDFIPNGQSPDLLNNSHLVISGDQSSHNMEGETHGDVFTAASFSNTDLPVDNCPQTCKMPKVNSPGKFSLSSYITKCKTPPSVPSVEAHSRIEIPVFNYLSNRTPSTLAGYNNPTKLDRFESPSVTPTFLPTTTPTKPDNCSMLGVDYSRSTTSVSYSSTYSSCNVLGATSGLSSCQPVCSVMPFDSNLRSPNFSPVSKKTVRFAAETEREPLNCPEQSVPPIIVDAADTHQPSHLGPSELKSMLTLLPRFGGDCSQYRRFKSRFCTIVDHMDLCDRDKALSLYLALEDSVVDVLGCINIGGYIDYDVLWLELDREFLRSQHGTLYHQASFVRLRDWSTCDTLEKLIALYKYVSFNYRAWEREGEEILEQLAAFTILSKLTNPLSDRVSSFLRSKPRDCRAPIIPTVLCYIREQIDSEEIILLARSLRSSHGSAGSPSVRELSSKNQSVDDTLVPEDVRIEEVIPASRPEDHSSYMCCFCSSCTHDSASCRRFNRPDDFQCALFKMYSCYNCLIPGHRSHECPKPKICSLCDDPRKHSPVLCRVYHTFV